LKEAYTSDLFGTDDPWIEAWKDPRVTRLPLVTAGR